MVQATLDGKRLKKGIGCLGTGEVLPWLSCLYKGWGHSLNSTQMSTDGSKFLLFTGETPAGLKQLSAGGSKPSVHCCQRNFLSELLSPGGRAGGVSGNKLCLEGRP